MLLKYFQYQVQVLKIVNYFVFYICKYLIFNYKYYKIISKKIFLLTSINFLQKNTLTNKHE